MSVHVSEKEAAWSFVLVVLLFTANTQELMDRLRARLYVALCGLHT